MPQTPKAPKPHPFTEAQVSAKAKALWEQRGEDSTDAENWADAIKGLHRERAIKRVTKPLKRLWWKTALGAPLQRWWQWTGVKEKKGWDVVQLLVGISIPIILFVGGQYFTGQNTEKQEQLADDKAKQDTLVKYLDQMAESMKEDLLTAKPGDKRFIVAQSRTVLALQSLDKKRQHLVIQFLQAAGLNKVSEHAQPDQHGKIQLKKGDKVLLYQAQMSKANLTNSDLSGGILIGVNLEQANLGCRPPDSKSNSQCSDLIGADLSGADLSGAHLSGAHLSGAVLSGADLINADLSGADLINADLSGADLFLADLSNADLSNADLSGANLVGAYLVGAYLVGAYLLQTDFRQAKDLTPQQIEGSDLCNVALPRGFTVNPYRDCDRLPQELLQRYPERFESLEAAKKYVDTARQKKWE